jgi:hypothetical protein
LYYTLNSASADTEAEGGEAVEALSGLCGLHDEGPDLQGSRLVKIG